MDKKWLVVAVFVLLAGLVMLGGFYWKQSKELEDTEAMWGLQVGSDAKIISGLQDYIETLQAEIDRLEAELAAAD